MRRFRVIRGGLEDSPPAPTDTPEDAADPALNSRLRAIYAPPGEGYWDGLEATIMAAVRAGRAAPAAAAEWCQTLARWARPGLAAATVLLGVMGGVYLQTRGSHGDALYRAVLEEPAYTIEPLDEEFARTDPWSDPEMHPTTPEARAAADLLTDGVKRRGHVPAELQDQQPSPTSTGAESMRDSAITGRGAPSTRRTP